MMHKIPFLACCGFFLAVAAAPPAAAVDPVASQEKERQLISILQSDAPPQEKAITCKRLAIYGTGAAVPALAPLLSDAHLASWARIALEAIPDPAADDALRAAMDKVQGLQLVGVINSIGVRRDAKAVDGLIARLNAADSEVASAAAVALGRIGDDRAMAALTQALATVPAGVRSAVAEGCILCAEELLARGKSAESAKLYDLVRKSDVPRQRMLEATRGAILARQAEGIPLLVETLRSPDKALFGIGLRTARELSGRAVTEALATELERAQASRQGPLLQALADRGDADSLPAIYAAARTGSKGLRIEAIGAMERLGNVAAVPVLLDVVVETDPELVQAARIALARLPGEAVNAELTSRLPGTTGKSRRMLIELAGQRRVSAAVPELIKASTETDPAIRAAAVKALGTTVTLADLGALTELLARAKSPAEASAAETTLEAACTRLPDKAACADKLLACLPTGTLATRCSVLRLLGVVSTPKALEAVRSSLGSPEADLRDTAIRVLADWSDTAALPLLLDLFRNTRDETQRVLALRGSVRLLGQGAQSPGQTVKTYGELMTTAQRPDERKLVLAGLANVPDPAALRLVEPLLGETSVRAEAELAALGIASGLAGTSPAEARKIATRIQAETTAQSHRERAAQILSQIDKVEDFITAWQVAGPYTEPGQGESLFGTAFPPEKPDAKPAWRTLPAGTQSARPWMLDLLAALSGESRVAYARTWVFSDREQPVRIEYGTDDGNKLWLNGKMVHQANRGGAAVPGDFKPVASLRQGWNAVLLKVIQDTGPWEFCLRIRTPAGARLDGLRVQCVSPGE
jgi:HEAT repeat protein